MVKEESENSPLIENPEKKKSKEQRRLVKKKFGLWSGGYFNLEFSHVPFTRRYVDLFHFMLDLSWWKLLIVFTVCYLLTHVCFGFLYFAGGLIDLSVITTTETNYFLIYMYCFFFSVDVMQTNGSFGIIVPIGPYERSVVTLESFFCYFFETLWIAFILGKFSRPSRMKKNYLFSKNAILRRDDKGNYNFCFRFANIRCAKSPQMSVDLNLLLIIWKDKKFFKVFHLDYVVYEQTPHSKEVQFSNPLLPLPHIVRHTVTPESPFFSFVNDPENLKQYRFEFVCVIEGIDSATSNNYQGFFSWTQVDTLVDYTFVPCCYFSKRKGKFIVDYNLFNKVEKMVYAEDDGMKVV